MSYTNETTHYGIPKPLGTDLTVPMDYNEAADAIDQALFDASTNASEAVTAAANAVDAASDAVEEVGSLGTEVNSLKGRTSALETSDVIQNNKIDALENQGVTKFDSVGIADAYVNGLTYSVGDVVTYNGQRYECITAVVAAEPFDADKWSAKDVETVLNDIKSDLTWKYYTLASAYDIPSGSSSYNLPAIVNGANEIEIYVQLGGIGYTRRVLRITGIFSEGYDIVQTSDYYVQIEFGLTDNVLNMIATYGAGYSSGSVKIRGIRYR